MPVIEDDVNPEEDESASVCTSLTVVDNTEYLLKMESNEVKYYFYFEYLAI